MTVERPKLLLKPDRCDACGRCVEECRHNAIRVGVGYIYVDWLRCDGCGKCVAYCDRDAILERVAPAPSVAGRVAVDAGPGREAGHAGWRWPKYRLWRPKQGTPGVGGGEAASPVGSGQATRWSPREAGLAVGAAVLLQIAVQAALASHAARSLSAAGIMLVRGSVLGLYYFLLAGLLFALARRRRTGLLSAFRLDSPPDLLSFPVGLGMLVGTWAFAMLYRAVAISAGWTPPAADSPSLETLLGSDAFGMTVTVLVLVLLGPFVEELLLRGVLLSALESRFTRWSAIVLSAVVFAVLHGSLWSFVPLTVLGLALGRLASRRRSLWPAVVLHVAYNAAIVVPGFLVVARG